MYSSNPLEGLERFSRRQKRRKEIIIEFYKLRAQNPHTKKNVIIREVATKLNYVIDRNKSNSRVATVLRDWEKASQVS